MFPIGSILAVVGFSAVSVTVVDRYHFGLDRHAVIVPFLKHTLDPGLFPADYLVAQQGYYYTFLWKALGTLLPAFPVDIETVFFLLYCVFTFLLFLAVYLISKTLFRSSTAALFALFLLLFANVRTLGSAYLFDQALIEKTVALPILLFAYLFFLQARLHLSAAALGLGLLVHPLTAVYVGAMLGVASVLELLSTAPDRLRPRAFMAPAAILAVLAAPMLVWRLRSSPESASLFHADPEWMELLRIRSGHHVFPGDWGLGLFVGMAVILLALAVGASQRPHVGRPGSVGPDPRGHRIVLVSILTLMVLWLLGTLFSEGHPVPALIQLQLFRSSSFVLLFAILYFGDFLAFAVSPDGRVWARLLGIVGSLAFLYHSSDARLAWIVLAVLILVAGVGGTVTRRWARERGRAPEDSASAPHPSGTGVPWDRFGLAFNLALVVAALALGGLFHWARGGYADRPILENANAYTWLEAQRWARDNTLPGTLFIVPPNLFGFRTESERSIYGDWKDGTQMFFNPSFGNEWMRRMRRLGYREEMNIQGFENLDLLRDAYEALREEDFLAIDQEVAEHHPQSYVVMFRFQATSRQTEVERLVFPVVYENEGFVVYEVDAGQAG